MPVGTWYFGSVSSYVSSLFATCEFLFLWYSSLLLNAGASPESTRMIRIPYLLVADVYFVAKFASSPVAAVTV